MNLGSSGLLRWTDRGPEEQLLEGRSYRVINSRDLPREGEREKEGDSGPTSLALSNSSANCT